MGLADSRTFADDPESLDERAVVSALHANHSCGVRTLRDLRQSDRSKAPSGRRWLGARRRWDFGLVAVVLICSAFSTRAAVAAPVDHASTHAALAALVRWETALMADAPISQQGDNEFVASVAAGCPNVLAALNLIPSQVNRAAPFALGEEIAADLYLARFLPAERALTSSLASAIERLSWSSGATRVAIRRSMQAERRYFALSTSNLCADARALAATNAQTTPPGTLQFLATFGRAFGGSGFFALNKTINRFKTAADGPLIRASNSNQKLLVAARAALVASETPKVLAGLGLS
jgi:hypothetical protein